MEGDSCAPHDAEIIRQVIAGDVNAFESLLRKYERFVMAIVKKHIPQDHIEDTAQEVFLRAYQSLPSFKGNGSFQYWLSVITVRTCYDFWRKHYKSREIPMSSLTEQHAMWLEGALSDTSNELFHERSLQREAEEMLDWALNSLSAADRMVLELVYLEGHSVKDTARLLGWSTVNIKVRLFRSRKKLHALLTGTSNLQKE